MFRTRDFLLLLTVAVFLVVAIVGTVLTRPSAAPAGPSIDFASTPDIDRAASLYEPESLSRAERLERMREKIAASGELTLSTPENIPNPTVSEATSTEDEPTAVVSGEPQRCAGFSPYRGVWSPQGVRFEVVEGARVVYREIVSEYELDPQTATTGTTLPPETSRAVLAQLPIRTLPSSNVNCLPTEVVGIAQDGSLIRNDEIGLYSVFGETTLIGYALDGFPMYGVSDIPTDTCGGAIVGGAYRYVLSEDRAGILNCFAGTPVAL